MPTTPDPTPGVYLDSKVSSTQEQIGRLRECLNDAQMILTKLLKETSDDDAKTNSSQARAASLKKKGANKKKGK